MTEVDLITQDLDERQTPLFHLLAHLQKMDIDPSLGDFMEREELAQIVVRRLLDTIDRLHNELARK
jgi:hypothetical protein